MFADAPLAQTVNQPKERPSPWRGIASCLFWLVLLSTSAMMLSACGVGAQADEPVEPFQIRPIRATFTPTPPGAEGAAVSNNLPALPGSENSSADGSVVPIETAIPADAGSTSSDSPSAVAAPQADVNFQGSSAVINTALVNGRSGPGTDFDIVGIVEVGQTFDVLGQNEAGDWWRVCCYDDLEFWVINDFVDVTGGSSVPQPAQPAQAVQAAPTQPPAAAATETPPPAVELAPGELPFDLIVQEQFSETSVVRVFLYAYSDQIQALSGYSIKVTKDGAELPVDSESFGPQAGYTWPIATARQRFQNLKVEFPGQAPAGTWVVELIDGGGKIVGAPATFNLTATEPNQELYVRYQQK